MAKKNDPNLIERAWDAVRGLGYEAKKGASSFLDKSVARHKEIEEQQWDLLKQREGKLQEKYPGSRRMHIEMEDSEYSRRLHSWSRQKDLVKKRKEQREEVSEKINADTSSRAAYERLTNSKYQYASVRELLADKAIVERFSSNGKSSFDIKLHAGRVPSIQDPQVVEELLQVASASVANLTQEQIETVLAFGDARLLGRVTQIQVEPEAAVEDKAGPVVEGEAAKPEVLVKETCLGGQLIERLGELRAQNSEEAQNNATTGEEVKTYVAKDKDLGLVCEMAETITSSAVEYFGNMMKAFQPTEQQ